MLFTRVPDRKVEQIKQTAKRIVDSMPNLRKNQQEQLLKDIEHELSYMYLETLNDNY